MLYRRHTIAAVLQIISHWTAYGAVATSCSRVSRHPRLSHIIRRERHGSPASKAFTPVFEERCRAASPATGSATASREPNANKRSRTRRKSLNFQGSYGFGPRSARGGRRFKSCHSTRITRLNNPAARSPRCRHRSKSRSLLRSLSRRALHNAVQHRPREPGSPRHTVYPFGALPEPRERGDFLDMLSAPIANCREFPVSHFQRAPAR